MLVIYVEARMESTASQKTVLITGCSLGGIGDALARSFHQKGLRVFATAGELVQGPASKGDGHDSAAA